MKDEMDKDLGGAVGAEEEAVKAFAAMTDAKKSEIAAASEAIESKSVRSGAPGGVEMAIGERKGGKVRTRSATHTLRSTALQTKTRIILVLKIQQYTVIRGQIGICGSENSAP